MRLNDLETPETVAVKTAVCAADTEATVTITEALVTPPGMLIVDGTLAFKFPLDSVAGRPDGGDAEPRFNVQMALLGPVTADGLHTRLVREADVPTVIEAVRLTLLAEAVTVTL